MHPTILPAIMADAPLIGRVVVEAIGPELAARFAGSGTVDDVRRFFAALAARTDSQYSYLNAIKALDTQQRPMGFAVGYDGARLHQLRLAFFEELFTHFGRRFDGPVADECDPDEYYLDSLTVFPPYRGQGVARVLIEAMNNRAHDCNKPLGLLCDKTNTRARRLYQSVGFLQVGEHPFAGELMDHLQIPARLPKSR